MFPREFLWAAVFGAIGGVVTVFCLNALKTTGEVEAREAEVQREESQNHPQEHDERSG